MALNSLFKILLIALLIPAALVAAGCKSPGNHITLVEVPSGTVAGVATERGIMVLKKPIIKVGDIYPIQHAFGNGVVLDEARVVGADEYLALLEPISSKLNTVRFLLYPIEPEEELYVGVLDTENEAVYIHAELLEGGAKGDFVICDELPAFPEPTADRYGGIGLFADRDGALWLAGLLTPMEAELKGVKGVVYPFVGMEKILNFIPDMKDNFSRDIKPFRPDFIYGVKRDGSGE